MNKESLGGRNFNIYNNASFLFQDSINNQLKKTSEVFNSGSNNINVSTNYQNAVQWWHKGSNITRSQAINKILSKVSILEKTESDTNLSIANEKHSNKEINKMVEIIEPSEKLQNKRKLNKKVKKLSKKQKEFLD